jgi:hypothetical protein
VRSRDRESDVTKRASTQTAATRPSALLVCAVEDEAVVGPLLDALVERDLTVLAVHNTAELDQYLQRPCAVLILWSVNSLRSAEVYEVARTRRAIDAYVLSEGVSAEDIPVTVRWTGTPVVLLHDVEQIRYKVLNALISTSGLFVASMGTGLGRVLADEEEHKRRNLEVDALKAASGKLVYAIPDRMFLREPEEVEIRVGRDGVPRLFANTVGSALPVIESLPVVEVMSVRIRAKPSEFLIEAMSPETQLVGGPFVEAFGQEQRQFGEWHFQLTPQKTGRRELFVRRQHS